MESILIVPLKHLLKFYFIPIIKPLLKIKKRILGYALQRAGNVIGGGDWSDNRLIPDCMKMWLKNKITIIRNPNSTRPWQHVLEALSGYMELALKLNQIEKNKWNFI